MKASNMGLLAVVGMMSVGATVYGVTPPGGFHTAIQAEPSDAVAAASSTAAPLGGATTQDSPSQFTAGTGVLLDARLGNAKLLKNAQGETFVAVEVRAGDTKSSAPPPVSMAIVIDKSGSMRGTRIQNALSGAVAAVEQLHDGDSVAVVAFDTRPDVVVPLTQIAPGTRERILSDIRGIQLGGDTCISCGIEEGLGELKKNRGDVERMLVLSDGDANNGVRDVPGFRSIGERAQAQGVSVTTIGVDVDFNEKLMTAIATSSNGRHYFVENDSGLAAVFAEEASSLGQSVAAGASVDFDLSPGIELVQVFDRNFTRSGGRVSVPLGSFARGEVKTVLLKVRVPSSSDATVPITEVKLTYRDLATSEDATASGDLAAELVADAKDVGELDPVVADRVQRSQTAAALREANNLFSLGKVEEARKRLQDQRAELQTIAPSATKAAPAAKAKAVGDDFAKQDAALDQAEQGFASPPPSNPASPAPAAPDRQQRVNQKRNEENSFRMGF